MDLLYSEITDIFVDLKKILSQKKEALSLSES